MKTIKTINIMTAEIESRPMTEQEISSLPQEKSMSPQEESAKRDSTRRKAYAVESDPIFFEFQRGEKTEQEWLDKVQEIKNRYP